MKRIFSLAWAGLEPLIAFAMMGTLITLGIGSEGMFPNLLREGAAWKMALYLIVMTHITITAMSLCFHRMHTHQGVRFAKWIDRGMQAWLAMTTGMLKLDWVSIHIYHHAHSDQEKDPHSPKHKGLARIFFLGVYDYVVAKNDPEVIKIRRKIPEDRFEAFLRRNSFVGPILTVAILTIATGPLMGAILSALTFMISPLFAVGGVNALAHAWGYRNHSTTDESRNLGFLFPLNWMICGELDHNNHHAHPRSCSFRHRWYEFDIGYFYIQAMSVLGWAEAKTVFNRSPRTAMPVPNAPARPESSCA